MNITNKILQANNDALKKAIDSETTLKDGEKDRKVKGMVHCDIVALEESKKHGFDLNEIIAEKRLVEASHALHNNENWETTHKLYMISA